MLFAKVVNTFWMVKNTHWDFFSWKSFRENELGKFIQIFCNLGEDKINL